MNILGRDSMTNNKAVSLLSQMFLPCFNDEEKEALTIAINAIQENSCKGREDIANRTEVRELKFVRDLNRIYTIMDFENGEEIEFAYYPSHPQSYEKGYVFYRSKKDGRTMLLTPDDISRCMQK